MEDGRSDTSATGIQHVARLLGKRHLPRRARDTARKRQRYGNASATTPILNGSLRLTRGCRSPSASSASSVVRDLRSFKPRRT